MDFIDEVRPTSLDGTKEELSVEMSAIFDDYYYIDEYDEESDAYYLVQFGVGGPA